jgi:5S rRNA maturation endonuclease (ribonuclease M5)
VISLQIVSDFVYKNFENVSVSKHSTHFHARCSLCGDSKKNKRKKRFNLDWKGGNPVFQCWNCGAAGSFIKLVSLIKGLSEEDAKRLIFSKYEPESINERLKQPVTPQSKPKSDLPTFNEVLDDCASKERVLNELAYPAWITMLDEFRATRQIPNSIPLYYAFRGDYLGRIIIPVFEGDYLVYFQARRRFDDDEGIVKYKNPPTEKARIIMNRHAFNEEKCIIVTEGLIDAFMVEYNQGTTMLGKELSQDFIKELLKRTKKNVIIAFDNDEEGAKSLRKHIPIFGNHRLRYFLMPKKYIDSKDINKVVIDHDIPNVYDFIVENSFTREICLNKIARPGR